jgi:hypothetical protein
MDKAGAPVMKPTWQLEGTFAAERPGETMEYSMVVSVRNERNEEIARQVVNVGAVQGAERRTFAFMIETSGHKK